MILCDVGDQHENLIRELTKVCIINQITIMVAWSYEEVAIYLQTYKAFENKSADSIKERVDQDYSSILRAALTGIKGVNKTDVVSLRTHFGSFSNIAHASPEDLANCPGIGSVKVRRLNEALVQPFRRTATREPREAVTQGSGEGMSNSIVPVSDINASNNALQPDRMREQELRLASLSPLRDIELDLNPSEDEDESSQSPSKKPTVRGDNPQSASPLRERIPSPDWDIDWTKEGENNSSDSVVGQEDGIITTPARKKKRTNPFSSTPL